MSSRGWGVVTGIGGVILLLGIIAVVRVSAGSITVGVNPAMIIGGVLLFIGLFMRRRALRSGRNEQEGT
jgi:uncharacterized membrane protein HdeD (DUF308 family)